MANYSCEKFFLRLKAWPQYIGYSVRDQRTEKQTDGRQTMPIARPLLKYGWLKTWMTTGTVV